LQWFRLLKGFAQHCPWDCSGMIIVETPVAKGMVYKIRARIGSMKKKKVIVDTMYGTDKPTYDRCDLLFMMILQSSAQKKLQFIIGTNTIRFIILPQVVIS
jgi:hypothetical protein